ncbi:porin [Ralstonia insidiosa]|nr:porin [Ralstonia insidiosa]KAB0472699.1 porin [Ralstonia insidiosa]MBY4907690.1 porin [Ralstonia insidiosa]
MRSTAKHWVLSICAAMTCCVEANAQTSVTLYGRLNTSIEYARGAATTSGADLGSVTRLTNNRSVFGLRGEEDLGGGTKAFWQIESAVSVDTGQGQLAGRNTAIGLEGNYGKVFMGHWQTPYTESTAGYDPYYPTTAGYMALIGNGSTSSSDNVQDTSSFDRRQKNIIQYRSPVWNGLSGSMAWGVNEEKISVPRNPALYSFAGAYDRGPLNITAAYEIHQHYQTAGRNDEAAKIGVAYQFPTTKIALLYERLHYRTATGDLYRNGYYVSLTQQLGPGSVRVGFALASNGSGSARETVGYFRSGVDTGATQLTVGYDYPLSKRTALYTYYSRINNRSNAIYDFAINQIGVKAGAHPETFVLGMRHSF